MIEFDLMSAEICRRWHWPWRDLKPSARMHPSESDRLFALIRWQCQKGRRWVHLPVLWNLEIWILIIGFIGFIVGLNFKKLTISILLIDTATYAAGVD